MDSFPIFVGEGTGGKSIFSHKLTVIFGPNGPNKESMLDFFKGQYTSEEIGEISTEMLRPGETVDEKLAQLEGKKLVFIKDFDSWDQIDGGLLKTVHGAESYYVRTGDAPGMMKTIDTKLVITTSNDPQLICSDKSLLSRINIVGC